jgi:coenzyme F420 hydrogenase subunit beta
MKTKTIKTIEPVVKEGLCTGCGTCVGICPQDAIEMLIDHRKGLYVPLLDKQKCTECGLCFKVCPGYAVDFKQLNLDIFGKEPDDILLGNYINCYLCHATDYDIRYNCSSGGMITALLIFALEEGIIDGALVTRMKKDRPLEPEPFIARTRDEIISAAGSKYCPVPANIALKEILNSKDGEKFAVVGLPCHIHGIRKAAMVNKRLREKIILLLGILCSHTDTFTATELWLRKHGIEKEKVVKLDYRGQGWPGSARILLNDGTTKSMRFEEFIFTHGVYLFTPRRCTLCCDALAKLADITVSDAWLPEIKAQDKTGSSIIVTRTERGEALCQSVKMKQVVELQKLATSDVIRAQGRSRLANKDMKVHFLLSRLFGRIVPNYNTSFPRPCLRNYLRGLATYFNTWVSSQGYPPKLMNLLVHAELLVKRQAKSILK